MHELTSAAVALMVCVAAGSYLAGCCNGAIITSFLFYHDDIRKHGSHNAGLTNFYRVYGGKFAVCVILIDMLKAFVAVKLGSIVFGGYLGLRLEGEYDFAVDLEESSIDLRKFALTLNEKESESASFRLRRPIRYSWREGAESTDQRATFDLECSAFDLKLLRFLIPGDSAFQFDSGYFTSRMQLTLRHNLSSFSLLGSGRINNSSCRWEGRKFELAEILAGLDVEIRRDFH